MKDRNENMSKKNRGRYQASVRPEFPRKAVVTAGMPYGNKELHFGHAGGVFIHADVYARFLRDRIGTENVIFVSGTDCYGSPIVESYRKACANEGYEGSIEDYVRAFHDKQAKTLRDYQISLDCYATSAFGTAGKIHEQVSHEIFETLYQNGWLRKMAADQFYDTSLGILLNGRQVEGRCPVAGCTAEKAYADECGQGHQYPPEELIDPISTLSGTVPIRKKTENWYLDLEAFREPLLKYNEYLKREGLSRKHLTKTVEEFLKPPVIYVQKKHLEGCREEIEKQLPLEAILEEEKKPSLTYVFSNLEARDKGRSVLESCQIRYRTGKTLVPFRLTGNIEWGVPVPGKEGLADRTFWVWPESLWAPISFLRSVLHERGEENRWEEWWKEDSSRVYQFMGEDNIYFYGIAQPAIFAGMEHSRSTPERNEVTGISQDSIVLNAPQTVLVPNRHVLFLNRKASSSSAIKPPMAAELLEYYTAEQLRMHFLSLGLASKSVSFEPAVYQEGYTGKDPVLKEGNLLTNVMNRLVRSCLYLIQEKFAGELPQKQVSQAIKEMSDQAVLDYERHMYRQEFHRVMYVLDEYIRKLNKHWSAEKTQLSREYDADREACLAVDCLHGVRTAAALLHPLAPQGCEQIRTYLNVGEEIWSWEHIFETLEELIAKDSSSDHRFLFLEPRKDFFVKHESQLAQYE